MGGVKPDWLAQLAPAHAPPPPGWWPLAPGWWGVAILMILALAGIAYWRSRPSVRRRRLALRELARLEATAGDDQALAQRLEHLLRRYAVAQFGRDAVAALSGERWIAFVVGHGGGAWAGSVGSDFLRAAYGGGVNTGRACWLDGARAFLKGRR